MLAECNGLPEGSDEDFTIWTGSHMSADFPANVRWEFVIDIGRQLPEKLHTMAFSMCMVVRRALGLFL